MIKRLLGLFVALLCFCGVGFAGTVSEDVSVKPVGVDEFFKDGVNGIRFGATLAECGDRVRWSSSSERRDDLYIYRRTDGLSLFGRFLSSTEEPYGCEMSFFFEGDDLNIVTVTDYDEVAYGVDGEAVIKWAKEVWGEPDRYHEESPRDLFYHWFGEEKNLMLIISWDDSPPFGSIKEAVVSLSVGYIVDDVTE